jgi:DNA-binding MurR/RpiR family transcriptional regulator
MRDASTSLKVVWQYLRYVPAAADKHSFRQAAADFGVWESTISRGIRELESGGCQPGLGNIESG